MIERLTSLLAPFIHLPLQMCVAHAQYGWGLVYVWLPMHAGGFSTRAGPMHTCMLHPCIAHVLEPSVWRLVHVYVRSCTGALIVCACPIHTYIVCPFVIHACWLLLAQLYGGCLAICRVRLPIQYVCACEPDPASECCRLQSKLHALSARTSLLMPASGFAIMLSHTHIFKCYVLASTIQCRRAPARKRLQHAHMQWPCHPQSKALQLCGGVHAGNNTNKYWLAANWEVAA